MSTGYSTQNDEILNHVLKFYSFEKLEDNTKENFLITNYDELFENGERIINFLNLKKNIAKDFPKRSNRTTKTLKQNES